MKLREFIERLQAIEKDRGGELTVVQDHTGDGYDCDYVPCVVKNINVTPGAVRFEAGEEWKE